MKERLAVWVLLFLATVLPQWYGGAYAAGWGGDPDEAAHVMTGLMIRDYLAAGCPWPPMRFAEQYYVHYPKVGLGQWPPFFYIVTALWTLPMPPGRLSLLLLMALISASTAAVLYEFLRRETGRSTAVAFALLLTTVPAVRQSASMVMSDGLVALLCLAAIWFYSRYLESGRLSGGLMFGTLAGLAMITKGTGIVLAAVPLLGVAAGRQWRLPRKGSFWAPAIVAIIIAGPWYAYQSVALPQNLVSWAGLGRIRAPIAGVTPQWMFGPAAWLVVPLAAAGLAASWYRTAAPSWAALGALALASWLMPSFIEAAKEPRHLLMTVAPVLAMAAAGVDVITRHRWPLWDPPPAGKRLGVIGFVLLACIATTFRIPVNPPAAFSGAAGLILSRTQAGDRILVSSESAAGEGDPIVELALREKRPGHLILRAFKMLCRTDWNSRRYRLLFSTPAEMQAELERLDVRLLIMDLRPSAGQFPHHAILKRLVAESSDAWPLLAGFPGPAGQLEVAVYGRTGDASRSRAPIEVPVRRRPGGALRENP
jgi:hypothetical protein